MVETTAASSDTKGLNSRQITQNNDDKYTHNDFKVGRARLHENIRSVTAPNQEYLHGEVWLRQHAIQQAAYCRRQPIVIVQDLRQW